MTKSFCVFAVLLVVFAHSDPPDTYRILVAITPAAQQAIQNDPFGRTPIEFIQERIIDATNEAMANSSTPQGAQSYTLPRVVLAGIVNVSYVESGSMQTDVNRLRGTTDGYMDNIHDFRDKYAADIVMLLLFHTSVSYTGTAYDVGVGAADAFQIVNYPQADFLPGVAHENGHLFGCRHHDDTHNTPAAYGHGYVRTGTGPLWSDLMANIAPSYYQPWLSNPYETYSTSGYPLQNRGTTGTANCTRLHQERKSIVEGFRSPVPYIFYGLTIPAPGAGEYAGLRAIDSILIANRSYPAGSELDFQANYIAFSTGFSTYGKLTAEAVNIRTGGYLYAGSESELKASNDITNIYGWVWDIRGKLSLDAANIYNYGYLWLRSTSESHFTATNEVILKTLFIDPGASVTIDAPKISISGSDMSSSVRSHFVAHTSIEINPGFTSQGASALTLEISSLGLAKKSAGNPNQDTPPIDAPSTTGSFFSKATPFSGALRLEYTLEKSTFVQLTVFDLKGQRVLESTLGLSAPGPHTEILKGPFNVGKIYMLRIRAGNKQAVHKFMI